MLEKEVKVLEINVDEVCKKIEQLWWEKTFEWEIHDIYYDFPWEENNKMEINKRMFRVRKKGEEHIYTIKRKRSKIWELEWVTAKDEHETKITDVESFSKVLEKYWMKKIREKIKHRISYNINWTEFDIDKYDEIPAILEIEDKSWVHIQEWIKNLWLDNHKQLVWWSRKLFKHYNIPYLNFE